MAALQISSMIQENSTADEPTHLAAGWLNLRERAFGIMAEHPPLARLLCALPLLALQPETPPDFALWETQEGQMAKRFLYHNRVPADLMLNCARAVTVALTVLFGLSIALWTRRRWGARAALLALALFCFDPNLLAHGRYVTNDLMAAFGYFLACAAWFEYLEQPSRKTLAIAAVCFGIGLLSKFSLLMLPIALIPMCLVRRRTDRNPAVPLFCLGAVAALMILAAYGFEFRVPATDRFVSDYLNETPWQIQTNPIIPKPVGNLMVSSAIQGFLRQVPIPAYSYFKGLFRFYNHTYTGHDAYLLGQFSRYGWWYYFPLAFLVKTPVSTLVMILISVVLVIRKPPRDFVPALLLPAVAYLAVALFSSINIGIRHLLPVYPFLFMAVGASLARRRIAALVPVALLMAESLSSYPHYLAFFNIAAGGSANGPRWLLDSNIDWGQDLKNLKRWMDRNAVESVYLDYFGSGDPEYYGVRSDPSSRLAAVSVNQLYFKDSRVRELRACRPEAVIGWSIYVFQRPCDKKPLKVR